MFDKHSSVEIYYLDVQESRVVAVVSVKNTTKPKSLRY